MTDIPKLIELANVLLDHAATDGRDYPCPKETLAEAGTAILALTEQLATARNDALEEAAKATERAGAYPVGGGDGGTYAIGSALDGAKAIRALKTPAKEKP